MISLIEQLVNLKLSAPSTLGQGLRTRTTWLAIYVAKIDPRSLITGAVG